MGNSITTYLSPAGDYPPCTNAVTVIDSQSFNPVATVLLDDVDRGAANPCDIMCVKTGGKDVIAVSLTGTDEVMFIEESQMISRIKNAFAMGLFDNETVVLNGYAVVVLRVF